MRSDHDCDADEPEHGKVQTIRRSAKGKFISGGLTGIVELLDDGIVIKSPFPGAEMENNILDIAKEASIYHRLGPHERLIQVLGHSRDGLVLEYMKNGDLKTYLRAQNSIPMSMKLKWAFQISQSVSLLHSNGIIHCDIKPRNFLLDAALDIKIIDFSGSSLDGCKPASGEGTRFYLPRHRRDPPTLATDLFALGSTLYEVFHETSPYEEIPSDQVEVLYRKKEFPNVSDIPCGGIIKRCWLSQVDSAEDVQAFIQAIILSKVNPDFIQTSGLKEDS
ncbi:kinase domain containing protein [Penicillium verhagenii]|uniref:kinase domain containing protein n=1 Tax=Penicillium verhagenii TaxID=1562060 RepID=UPI002545803A|nr:kinase domain containing protein [Penicillium verhagenii]KAJ5919312.1 kinase domain containing protein [Penicillium verhagenii]